MKKLSKRGREKFLELSQILETVLPSERERILKALFALHGDSK